MKQVKILIYYKFKKWFIVETKKGAMFDVDMLKEGAYRLIKVIEKKTTSNKLSYEIIYEKIAKLQFYFTKSSETK